MNGLNRGVLRWKSADSAKSFMVAFQSFHMQLVQSHGQCNHPEMNQIDGGSLIVRSLDIFDDQAITDYCIARILINLSRFQESQT